MAAQLLARALIDAAAAAASPAATKSTTRTLAAGATCCAQNPRDFSPPTETMPFAFVRVRKQFMVLIKSKAVSAAKFEEASEFKLENSVCRSASMRLLSQCEKIPPTLSLAFPVSLCRVYLCALCERVAAAAALCSRVIVVIHEVVARLSFRSHTLNRLALNWLNLCGFFLRFLPCDS